MFCEKPVGGTPEQTVRAERAARDAGVITGVGYNYRWAPLVRYAAQLIADGALGEITNYRGRFFSMYGSDPLGVLSWRFLVDEAGHGVTTDLMSHSVDLAHMLLGPITRVVGTTETFIRERPLRGARPAATTAAARPTTRRGAVTNEDYAGMLCEFASGARGTFEASRSIVGPESQMAFDVYGTKGALGWNLEKLNELQLYLRRGRARTRATGPSSAATASPTTAHFVPGQRERDRLRGPRRDRGLRVLPLGRRGPPARAGLRGGASSGSSVQAALLRSVADGPLGGRRLAAGGLTMERRSRRRPRHRVRADRRHRRRAHRPHARRAARAPGAGRGA